MDFEQDDNSPLFLHTTFGLLPQSRPYHRQIKATLLQIYVITTFIPQRYSYNSRMKIHYVMLILQSTGSCVTIV